MLFAILRTSRWIAHRQFRGKYFLRQLFDRVTSIAQNSLFSINKGNLTLTVQYAVFINAGS